MNIGSQMNLGGQLNTRIRRNLAPESINSLPALKAPLSWKLRNTCTRRHLQGLMAAKIIAPLANKLGVATLMGELSIKVVKADGQIVDYGVVSHRLVTDTGVAFLVDDWDASVTDISTMNFHGCGTGTNAENATDATLQTESTTALNPDSTRATGTRSQPAANQYRSVGTLTFDATAAVTEHGLVSTATSTYVLWDRSVFSAINVASGDSIQFTYTVTLTSGG